MWMFFCSSSVIYLCIREWRLKYMIVVVLVKDINDERDELIRCSFDFVWLCDGFEKFGSLVFIVLCK